MEKTHPIYSIEMERDYGKNHKTSSIFMKKSGNEVERV